MNIEQLKKNLGKHLKLRPRVQRRLAPGQDLPFRDDLWSLDSVDKRAVELRNITTGHFVRLGPDNIREFRTPNFLLLRCQLTLQGYQVIIDPL